MNHAEHHKKRYYSYNSYSLLPKISDIINCLLCNAPMTGQVWSEKLYTFMHCVVSLSIDLIAWHLPVATKRLLISMRLRYNVHLILFAFATRMLLWLWAFPIVLWFVFSRFWLIFEHTHTQTHSASTTGYMCLLCKHLRMARLHRCVWMGSGARE